MFKLEEVSSFKYWFAHWCAFQMTALNLHCWKLRFLLHDLEKPFLKLLWRDNKRVTDFHKKHAKHHPQGKSTEEIDYVAMVIDWECGRFTKEFAPIPAREFFEKKYKFSGKFNDEQIKKTEEVLNKLGL